MRAGKFVFAQLMEFLPWKRFQRAVTKYNGNHYVKRFSCANQFLCMAFAQLTYRESLRDVEACLRAQGTKLYHLGIRAAVSRSTLADANESRDWRIYAELAQALIAKARVLYATEPFALDLQDSVYALDATTIELCLSLFPWARFAHNRAAVKLHTLLDLHGNIPSFVHVTEALVHEVNILDALIPEPGAFYVLDRGYTDFARLYRLHQHGSFFVIRAKSPLRAKRRYSHRVDRSTGVMCDQSVVLTVYYSHKAYPEPLRRVRIKDLETGKSIVLLTNNWTLPAPTIGQLYRCRWQIELFFKWIKQHLRIKAFFGISANAVKTQIWIAVAVYVLVAIVKKRLALSASLYELLQILSLTMFETTPLDQLLSDNRYDEDILGLTKQLPLFDF
jgi:nitrogen fixation protein/lambda repressor-like predicted transcriptional regulator